MPRHGTVGGVRVQFLLLIVHQNLPWRRWTPQLCSTEYGCSKFYLLRGKVALLVTAVLLMELEHLSRDVGTRQIYSCLTPFGLVTVKLARLG